MIIFPGIIGAIATAKTTPSAPLNLQISTDFGLSWQEGPISDFYFSSSSKSYDIRAIGSGTETLQISNTNGNFAANLSNSSIIGNDPLNIQLTVFYNGFGGETATVTVFSLSPGTDSIILNLNS